MPSLAETETVFSRLYMHSYCVTVQKSILNLTLNCGATEKTHNIGAQLQSLPCTKASNLFWKIYFLCDLVRTNLFVTSHYRTPDAKFDNCCQRLYIATCGKKTIGL